MFSQNEKDVYQSIKAAPELRAKVMALDAKKDRAFILKPSLAYALAAILICSVFMFNILDPSYGIYLDGDMVDDSFVTFMPGNEPQAATFMARDVSSRSADFTIKLKEGGILTAQTGNLTAKDPKTLEILDEGLQVSLGKETLITMEAGFDTDIYYLSLYTEGEETFYALKFNSDGSYALKKN